MTTGHRAEIEAELQDAIALLGTIRDVSDALEVDAAEVNALRAVRVLLDRQLRRIDDLLLALSADRLDDEAGEG